MPLDGVRFMILGKENVQRILQHPEMTFLKLVDEKGGEVFNQYQPLKTRGLIFTPHPDGTMTVQGPFFEFFKLMNNIEDFHFDDVRIGLDEFCTTYAVMVGEAKEIRVDKLEIGFNIESNRCPRDILRNIITYRYRPKEVSTYRGKGRSVAFDFEHYKLLFYDKGKKHMLKNSLLRVELVGKQGLLRSKGIYSLEDLYDRDKILALCLHLRKCVEEMVFTDYEMDPSALPERERALFHRFRTDGDWEDLTRYSRDNSSKTRHRYQAMIARYASFDTRRWLLQTLDAAIQKHGLGKEGQDYRLFSAVDKRGKTGTMTI